MDFVQGVLILASPFILSFLLYMVLVLPCLQRCTFCGLSMPRGAKKCCHCHEFVAKKAA